MPKVTLFYHGSNTENPLVTQLHAFGRDIQPLVAELASTPTVQLTVEDVDWITYAYTPASIGAFAIEIETIGFPERIERFNREAVLKLKKQILALPSFPSSLLTQVKPDALLIWIKFQNPLGVHV